MYGSPEFFAAWQAAASDLIRDARLHGLKVVWAIPPPPPPDLNGDTPVEDWSSQAMRVFVTTLTAAYERNYPADFGVTTADWWQALSDTNGHWQETLWYDQAWDTVRARIACTSPRTDRSVRQPGRPRRWQRSTNTDPAATRIPPQLPLVVGSVPTPTNDACSGAGSHGRVFSLLAISTGQ